MEQSQFEKEYRVHVYDTGPDGKPIAYGTSSWLILDHTTKKVQRPEAALSHFRRNFKPAASPLRYASKLEPANENPYESALFRVKISDLDVNLHTNNVRYLQWISDTYDLSFVMNNVPQSVEINYLSESLFNDEVFIKTEADKYNEGFYNHSVFRSADSKELCRVRIEWGKKL